MGQIAFVFSGQGDQYPGMGRELYETSSVARRVFETCDRIRPGTMEQCFSGTVEELKQTRNTQPCLFALELAMAQTLLERGVRPHAVAGFSLGEMAAAAIAGCFDLETGFRLVCSRGQLMDQAAGQQDTAMVAVLKLTAAQVENLCREVPEVYPVNFNGPGNTTVSGLSASMPALLEKARAAGGRAIPLQVQGAFHSPWMREAAELFRQKLEQTGVSQPTMDLYSNVTGAVYDRDAARLLGMQIASPVQWETSIRNMIAGGVDMFLEIGPGRTLTGMIRKIDPQVAAMPALEFIKEANPC